ncbi:MAG TPA: class I SAM-dependent methyltransferase [Polyangiaceae bacterium]|jgi:ubiquinone/menaquinone biosynthesis C-methylase UbiE|nr:class I SAM-dependent methyltransferase [Polyangiaceae bacterium]
MADDNAVIIEAWNTVLFEKFSRFKHLLTKGLGVHGAEFLRRDPFPKGARVLDVGCGFGDTTIDIAAAVGARGSAVGIDCAPNFVRAAEADAAHAGTANASFLVADAQSSHLGGPYDYAFSRFGTMFFNLPGAALRNIRRSLVPGGKLCMIVWRRREDNPWTHEAELRVKQIVPVVSHEETDQVHCGPGPFSMAGPDLVSNLVGSAGFRRITFERHDADICIGESLEEAVEFGMALGPAGEIIRLAGEEGIKRKPEVVAALTEVFERYRRPDGVWPPSSVWFVTAENPLA